jgi:hypothetical protein
MRTEDLPVNLPIVVECEIGILEPEGIALRLTYATSRERFENHQWDTAVYGFPLSVANALLKLLRKQMRGTGAVKH